MTLTLVLLTLLILTATAAAHRPAHGKLSLQDRVAFLEGAAAHHRYVCRHGRNYPRWWHCQALGWTSRELAEARAAVRRWEWTVPAWPWLAIAHCEQRTGPSLTDVNWAAYSASYEGGYGFAHSTWRRFRSAWMPATASAATPRVQTIVAKRLHAFFGNYSSWPACHRRLGLP